MQRLRLPRAELKITRNFYCDTATFGCEPMLLQLAVMFIGAEHVLFGTDTPMDSLGGAVMAGESARSIEAMLLPPTELQRIFHGNIHRLLADGPHPLARLAPVEPSS